MKILKKKVLQDGKKAAEKRRKAREKTEFREAANAIFKEQIYKFLLDRKRAAEKRKKAAAKSNI